MRYFAYGSNMDRGDLKLWCKHNGYKEVRFLEEPKAAKLDDWELVFDYYSMGRGGGAANIRPARDKNVYGLLLDVSEQDFATIATKEGAPNFYEQVKPDIEVTLMKGGILVREVKTFKVVKKREQKEMQVPTKEYMKLLLDNAIHNRFPVAYVKMLRNIPVK